MLSAPPLPSPPINGLDPGALDALAGAKSAVAAKARAMATDFEGSFLSVMFGQMMTDMDGEGPLGGSGATGMWRSFLGDEYAKSFAKAGGIGLADHVYSQLLALQEQAAAKAATGVTAGTHD
ncbi:MAG: rod-binding protein [Hyphomicrobiales bacterium]|nr:rod-binding protein [Hyphomicrobiales bacterium]